MCNSRIDRSFKFQSIQSISAIPVIIRERRNTSDILVAGPTWSAHLLRQVSDFFQD